MVSLQQKMNSLWERTWISYEEFFAHGIGAIYPTGHVIQRRIYVSMLLRGIMLFMWVVLGLWVR